jgi:hypothetical protein
MDHEPENDLAHFIVLSVTPTIRQISFCRAKQTLPTTGRARYFDAFPRISLLPNDGKMNVQLVANEENQNRAQRRKNESGGMISFVPRAQEHMGKSATEERSDDAENNRPEDRHVHMHH